MLNNYKGQAAVWGHMVKEAFQGFQTAGRGAQSHDQQRAWQIFNSSILGQGRIIVWRAGMIVHYLALSTLSQKMNLLAATQYKR
jgi:hypothetical protein